MSSVREIHLPASGPSATALTLAGPFHPQQEGRALGEVLKFLVYNARKRGGDSAAEYFRRTEAIAGVKGELF